VRRDAIAKVEENFVDIAPSPPFRRVIALNDRMARCLEMLGGVSQPIETKET
jgi:hypothetical protein